ncbi:uncharacterized protein TNCV_4429301 [Trichonephila clavipes]|nr:uncharacterized protein TNCV_4429301 [Trichonephila clavipes]
MDRADMSEKRGKKRLSIKMYRVVDSVNVTCLTVLDRGLRNSSRQRARWTIVVRRSFEHHTGDSTTGLVVVPSPVIRSPAPNLEGKYLRGCQGPPTSLPLPPTSKEYLRLDGYLVYPHAAKVLNIYKDSCLLRDLNPDLTAQRSTL